MHIVNVLVFSLFVSIFSNQLKYSQDMMLLLYKIVVLLICKNKLNALMDICYNTFLMDNAIIVPLMM